MNHMLSVSAAPRQFTGLVSAMLLFLFVAGLVQTTSADEQQYRFRVAVASFQHETCTFCPGGDPGIDDWLRLGPPWQGDEVLQSTGYARGFTRQTLEFDDTLMLGLTSPRGVFGGTSRSWNQQAVFDHFVEGMLEELRAAMPVDGVYLALHGAMAVRGIPRPEAEMARRFREVVGPDVPIVATFDLHGNMDAEFLRHANSMFVTKRFPHYDDGYQGERAARALRAMMRGSYEPTSAVRRPPILTATVLQWTGQSPLMDVMERARRWENRVPGAQVNVFLGFPWADVPTLGTSIHVITNNDHAQADAIADDMAEFIWRVREQWASGSLPGTFEAVTSVREAIAAGETPVVLADYWDRPGDGTWTLQALLDQGVEGVLYASLTDAPTLDRIWAQDLQPGDTFVGAVGGYTGEQAGAPVEIEGTLRWRGSRWGYEQVAVIEYGAAERPSMLILVPAYQQNITPEDLRFGPIEPDNFDVFVLKTRVHFRRGFDETGYAAHNILVDAPGDWFGTLRLEALDYENNHVGDFYPFGEPADQRAEAPDRW